METKQLLVEQKSIKVIFEPYVFANNQTRKFYCNAVLFNNQGTGNVSINNIYTLLPGDTLSLGCNQNEIDMTTYQITFVAGFTNKLAVFAKINENAFSLIAQGQAKFSRPIDRRKAVKQYAKKAGRGDF